MRASRARTSLAGCEEDTGGDEDCLSAQWEPPNPDYAVAAFLALFG